MDQHCLYPINKEFSTIWHYRRWLNDEIWVQISYQTILPLAFIMIYKFFKPIKWSHYKDRMPPMTLIDYICCVFVSWGLIYYVYDLLFYIMIGKFDMCALSYILHHITSLIFLPGLALPHYYPWWQLGVPLFHALIFYFPTSFFLEICYLSCIILFNFGIYTEPFKRYWMYKISKVALIFIYFSVIGMSVFGCRSQ